MINRLCLAGLVLVPVLAGDLRAGPGSEEEPFQASCAGAMAATDKVAAAGAELAQGNLGSDSVGRFGPKFPRSFGAARR